jgi:hypothetical protein
MTLGKSTVFEACDALSARGLDVTLASVRAELGGRGSFSTLGPMVRAWKDERRVQQSAAPVPLPDGMTAQAARMVEGLWSSALSLARVQVTRSLEADLAAERAAQAEVAAEVSRLEQELARCQEELAAVSAALAQERSEALRLSTRLGAAEERATQSEERLREERGARAELLPQVTAARGGGCRAARYIEGVNWGLFEDVSERR